MAGIAKQGLEVHHPLIGSIRHEQKMMEVKIVQKKYGFTKFLIEKCSVSIRSLCIIVSFTDQTT